MPIKYESHKHNEYLYLIQGIRSLGNGDLYVRYGSYKEKKYYEHKYPHEFNRKFKQNFKKFINNQCYNMINTSKFKKIAGWYPLSHLHDINKLKKKYS